MSRTSLETFNCSLARTADIIGDKWSLLVLRDAFYGIRRFSQFQKRLGLAKTVLSDRLSGLVDAGVLEKRRTAPKVDRFEYYLTPKGRDLFPVIVALAQWGDQHIFGETGAPVLLLDKQTESLVQRIMVHGADGSVLSPSDVQFAPGKGATEQTKSMFKLG